MNAEDIKSKSKLMVVNARNPFGRILSAWRDKFRIGCIETKLVIKTFAFRYIETHYPIVLNPSQHTCFTISPATFSPCDGRFQKSYYT